MRVLKRGKLLEGWPKDFVCNGNGFYTGGCGSKLLVDFEDLFPVGRNNADHATFKCPLCGRMTIIAQEHLPKETSPAKLRRQT